MKKLFVSIATLLLILLITPIFLSSKFSMSRSIKINAPVANVFAKLIDLNEYNKWNPFPEGDPSNKTNIVGVGLDSTLTWNGEKTGEGKMTISNIEHEKVVTVKMDFFKPMKGEGTVLWITNQISSDQTELIWSFDQELSYFSKYFGLFMESMMGEHFERGLVNFKELLESS